MILHHPDDTTLLHYATGAMPEVLKIVTATHLTFCKICRDAVADLETLGGLMLQEIEPMSMSNVAHTPFNRRKLPTINSNLPAPLNHIPFGYRWWPITDGFWWRAMRVPGPGWGGLLWGRPSSKLPLHRHIGIELACVLAGSFIDSGGEYFVGDTSDPQTNEHAEVPIMITGTQPCLCVIASEGMYLQGVLGFFQRTFRQ